MSAADIVSIISAISVATVAIITAMAKMSGNRKRQIGQNTEKLENIHLLVNGRLSEALDKIKRLEGRMDAQGMARDVPPDTPAPPLL